MRSTWEVENNKGSRSIGKPKKVKVESEFDIVLKEEERKLKKRKQLEEIEIEMRPWVKELFDKMNNKESLLELFIVWEKQYGFQNEKWANVVKDLIQRGNWKGFAQTITNMWLNSFEDCNTRFRKTRFKRTKLFVEKNPQNLFKYVIEEGEFVKDENGKYKMELTKYGEKQQRIKETIEDCKNGIFVEQDEFDWNDFCIERK